MDKEDDDIRWQWSFGQRRVNNVCRMRLENGDERDVFFSDVAKLAENSQRIAQIDLLAGRWLQIVGIDANGAQTVVGGGGGKGSVRGVLPKAAAGRKPAVHQIPIPAGSESVKQMATGGCRSARLSVRRLRVC